MAFLWGKSWNAFDYWMITIGCWDSKFGTTHHVWVWLQFPYLLGSRHPTSPHFRWMIIVQPDPLTFMFPIYMSCFFWLTTFLDPNSGVLVIDPTIYIYIYTHTQLHSHKIPDPIETATLGPPFLRTQPSKSIQIHPTPRWEEFSEWFRQSERWTIGACEVFHYFVVKRRRYNCSAAMSYGTWFVAWLEGEMLAIQLLL